MIYPDRSIQEKNNKMEKMQEYLFTCGKKKTHSLNNTFDPVFKVL